MKKFFFAAMSVIFNVSFVGMCISALISTFSSDNNWAMLRDGFTFICFWPLYYISCELKTQNAKAKNLLSRIYDWSHYKDSPYMKEVDDFLNVESNVS